MSWYTIGTMIVCVFFVCDILLCRIAFGISQSILGLKDYDVVAYKKVTLFYFLMGLIFFIIRCCLVGIIGNLFNYSAIIMAVIKGFDYACWISLLTFLFNYISTSRGGWGFTTIVGYVAGILLMEKLF